MICFFFLYFLFTFFTFNIFFSSCLKEKCTCTTEPIRFAVYFFNADAPFVSRSKAYNEVCEKETIFSSKLQDFFTSRFLKFIESEKQKIRLERQNRER
jgi:hypothetical protein